MSAPSCALAQDWFSNLGGESRTVSTGIVTTTTTTHFYDFPDSAPRVDIASSTANHCPATYDDPGSSGGFEGGGGGGGCSGCSSNSPDPGCPDAGGGGGGGGGKVLCTYFYLKGMLPDHIYKADSTYAATRVSDDVRNGYHVWAVPLVERLQTGQHPYLEKFLYFWVRNWAYEMAHVMGEADRSPFVGRVMRLVGEPLCSLIGKCVSAQDYRRLWI